MSDVRPGIYRHFKGGEYVVLATAIHSETHEPFVLYRSTSGDPTVWIRPKTMFFEIVPASGELVPRFQLITPIEESTVDELGCKLI